MKEMKKALMAILAIACLILLMGQDGCDGTEDVQPQATLNVQLVQMITPITWVVVEGEIPIDLNNINWSWMKEKKSISSIRENSNFVTRFEMNYPLGLPTKDDVVIMIAASSDKIPQLGIITSGYGFIGKSEGTIRGEEVDMYRYNYGQLKEGASQSIIIGGTTGSLGTSLEDKKPIYIWILEGEEKVISSSVDITISRPKE